MFKTFIHKGRYSFNPPPPYLPCTLTAWGHISQGISHGAYVTGLARGPSLAASASVGIPALSPPSNTTVPRCDGSIVEV